MPPTGPPNEQEILRIARRTTDIIQARITSDVCLCGSAAAYLWTYIDRVPNVCARRLSSRTRLRPMQDIDIVVSHGDAESIKRVIVDADDRYYLEPSKQHDATHEILFCRLPGWNAYGRSVKVDILVPPTLDFPEIDSSETPTISRIPVLPLFDLLIMKTQGWWHHRTSNRKDFREKVGPDVTDIDALLDRAVEEMISYQDECEAYRHTSEFLDWGLFLANQFARRHGWKKWRAIGFPF
jgi:hypothetical protein